MIAITGGTGFVGGTLIEQAHAAGIAVRALARREQDSRDGVEWITGDLADRAALARLVAGADAVIHVAGLTTATDVSAFEAPNVYGTLAVVEAAMAEGVPRFVFVSSLAAREPALSVYGASKARAERLVKASGLDWTIVRPPAIYGPRDRDMFEMFRAAKLGVVPVPRAGRASLLHVEDLARLLLVLVASDETTMQQTFEPDDGRADGWTHHELALAIGVALDRRPRVIGLSPRVLGWAGRTEGLLRGDKAKLTPDRVGYLSHPDWVTSAAGRVPPALWRPRIDTRTGLRATAQWYRKQGWL